MSVGSGREDGSVEADHRIGRPPSPPLSAGEWIKALVTDAALRRYVGVGIFNTCVDFALYSLGTAVFHWYPLVANVVSTTITLCVSYFLNRRFVFRSNVGYARSIPTFVAVTLFSGLLVQSGVIWLVLHAAAIWTSALDTTLIREAAKVIAIGVGMCSNYVGYHWLFRQRSTANQTLEAQH